MSSEPHPPGHGDAQPDYHPHTGHIPWPPGRQRACGSSPPGRGRTVGASGLWVHIVMIYFYFYSPELLYLHRTERGRTYFVLFKHNVCLNLYLLLPAGTS
jgi:hypothetical protein